MKKRESGLHKSKQFCVSVSETTHAKLKRIGARDGVPMDAVIAAMLDRAERES